MSKNKCNSLRVNSTKANCLAIINQIEHQRWLITYQLRWNLREISKMKESSIQKWTLPFNLKTFKQSKSKTYNLMIQTHKENCNMTQLCCKHRHLISKFVIRLQPRQIALVERTKKEWRNRLLWPQRKRHRILTQVQKSLDPLCRQPPNLLAWTCKSILKREISYKGILRLKV